MKHEYFHPVRDMWDSIKNNSIIPHNSIYQQTAEIILKNKSKDK